MKKEVFVDALMVEPGARPEKVCIFNDMESFQVLVSEDWKFPSEVEFFTLEDHVCLFRNAEGYLLGFPGNRRVKDEIIAGTFFIVGLDDNGETCSLSKEALAKYRKRFWKIETYTDEEVRNSYWNSWFTFIDELESTI